MKPGFFTAHKPGFENGTGFRVPGLHSLIGIGLPIDMASGLLSDRDRLKSK